MFRKYATVKKEHLDDCPADGIVAHAALEYLRDKEIATHLRRRTKIRANRRQSDRKDNKRG